MMETGIGAFSSGTFVAPLKIQCGTANVTNTAGGATILWPVAFPNGIVGVWVTLNGGGTADSVGINTSGMTVKNYTTAGTQITSGTSFVHWLAIGA
jgi:hypothetical protein